MTVYAIFLKASSGFEDLLGIHETMTGAELHALEFYKCCNQLKLFDEGSHRIEPMELLP